MTETLGAIGLVSHLVAALGFSVLGVLMLMKRDSTLISVSVGVAAFLTAAWAAINVLDVVYETPASALLTQAETVRSAAWLGVLVLMQRRGWGLDDRPSSSFIAALALGFVIALQLVLGITVRVSGPNIGPLAGNPAALIFVGLRLVVAISGLVLLHNLYINSRDEHDPSFRMFAVGLGLIFAYDLNLYTLYFLLGEPSAALAGTRGAVNALAVPLIFVAVGRSGHMRFQMSRQAAFHTVSFTIIGAYLIVMSFLAYLLRLTGGHWGALLQAMFVALALAAGVLVLLSPKFRAELKVRISRNFYRYRYDYRVEWLRFIDTMDGEDGTPHGVPIEERIVRAIAAVVDCPGGILIEATDGGGYEVRVSWGWDGIRIPPIPREADIVHFLAETGRVVDFDRLREKRGSGEKDDIHDGLTAPDWAFFDRSIWIAVPLIHRETLVGILLLKRTLASRDLNWEDYDLLRTLGRQGASYLVEAAAQQKLDESRRFEEFNRRFAFVMHDLKNVVSQLRLLARNAERHADNPEFRADMVATLKSSVTKMTDLMQLLSHEVAGKAGTAPPERRQVDLVTLTGVVVATLRRGYGAIALDVVDQPLTVAGDAGRLEAAITHILQNAVDASTPGSPVELLLRRVNGRAVLQVRDHGVGMTPAFVAEDLFKPFRSTKADGFGIGAFEAREILRAHGGRLDVESTPGVGSCFILSLPLWESSGLRLAAHG